MRCEDFTQNYSDFRDGLVTDEARAEYEAHVASCGRCRRYDQVVDRGVLICADLPAPATSSDFLPRLQHRIYHLEDAAKLTTRRAVGSAALVAVAGVGFLAVTWLPFATRMSVEVHLPPVAVEAPAPGLANPRSNLFETGRPLLSEGAFFMPFHPTLDESPDLFTTFSLPVGEPWSDGLGGPAIGQLDSAR